MRWRCIAPSAGQMICYRERFGLDGAQARRSRAFLLDCTVKQTPLTKCSCACVFDTRACCAARSVVSTPGSRRGFFVVARVLPRLRSRSLARNETRHRLGVDAIVHACFLAQLAFCRDAFERQRDAFHVRYRAKVRNANAHAHAMQACVPRPLPCRGTKRRRRRRRRRRREKKKEKEKEKEKEKRGK